MHEYNFCGSQVSFNFQHLLPLFIIHTVITFTHSSNSQFATTDSFPIHAFSISSATFHSLTSFNPFPSAAISIPDARNTYFLIIKIKNNHFSQPLLSHIVSFPSVIPFQNHLPTFAVSFWIPYKEKEKKMEW